MQPAVPGSWVSAPVVRSRANATTALLVVTVAYRWAPSGLMASPAGPARKLTSMQAPPVPVSLTQPAVPGSWVSAPVDGLREKTVMALLVWALAYTWRPSGLITMSAGPSKDRAVGAAPAGAGVADAAGGAGLLGELARGCPGEDRDGVRRANRPASERAG
jgi:hypothetical protein